MSIQTGTASPIFEVVSICRGGGYRYARTNPPHPHANAKGLYPLHRVVMENKLGRLLSSEELVHHDDEDKSNDAPENLVLKTRAAHSRDHALVEAVVVSCHRCGQSIHLKPHALRLRQSRNKNGFVYCSRRCGSMR